MNDERWAYQFELVGGLGFDTYISSYMKKACMHNHHQGKEQQVARDAHAHVQSLRMRTKSFALRVVKLYRSLPRTTDAQVIGKQLLRAGTSVGANYREGHRARSDAEMLAKFGICIQELDESSYWMELLIETDLVKLSVLAPLLDETNQLIAIFTASVKRIAADEK